MKKIIIFMAVLFLTITSWALNQSELLYYHAGVSETAMGSSVGSFNNNVAAGVNNPASLATIQQIKFSSMFGDIIGNNAYIYVGSAIPTDRGVLGVSGRYFKADNNSLLSKAFGGDVIWAKPFTDNVFVGLGFKVFQEYYTGGALPQIAGDIGVIYRKKLDVNKKRKINVKDFSIGGSLLNLGNFFKDDNDKAVSLPLQIKVGPSMNLGITKNLNMKLGLDFSLVNFTKFHINFGVENQILDKYFFNIGYLFNNDLNYLSFGAGYLLKIKQNTAKIALSYIPYKDGTSTLYAGVDLTFGTIDKQPPKIEFNFEVGKGSTEKEVKTYISPNYDGKKDTLPVNLKIKDNSTLEGWKIEIVDNKGNVVKDYHSPDIRTLQGKITFKKMITRLFEKKKQVPVPSEIKWDGKNNNGKIVADGDYKMIISAWDENKNTYQSHPKTIVVDNTPPTAEVSSDLTLFSPNGDGAKDTITFKQNTTGQDFWKGEIRNKDNKVVKHYEWKNTIPPQQVVWTGKDDNGKVVPNGIYSYFLTGEDKAENSVEKKVINITLTTNKQSASIDADKNIFSPNSDGSFDSITFSPILSSTSGLINWKVVILNEDGKTVKTFQGKSTLPKKITWDGTDDNNTIVPDGNYYYKFTTEFNSGNHPASFAKALIVDNTKPETKFDLSSTTLSPDNDGKDDNIEFNVSVKDANNIKKWEVKIVDENNTIVRTFSGTGMPAKVFSWNGLKDDGKLVQGGEIYSASFEVEDVVANKTIIKNKEITIDSTPPDISLKVKYKIFSPDNDGDADVQEFSFAKFDKKQLANWELNINLYNRKDKKETLFKSFSGTNLVSKIDWNGKNEAGQLVKGGQIFKVVFIAKDILGNKVIKKDSFAVDTTPPYIVMKLNPTLFSPDDDGQNDIEYINLIQKDKKAIKNWSIKIYPTRDGKRESLFKSFSGTELSTAAIQWDGKGNKGELVESAQDYDVEFNVSDILGNVTTGVNTLSVDVLVIKMPYGLKIKISNIGFEYNKADLKGKKTFYILDKVAKVLKKYKTYKVEIDGHTDNIGSAAYNENLSQKRAEAVLKFLTNKGISAENLRGVGKGFSMPVASNDTEEGRAKNRRVEFLLYKNGWPDTNTVNK